MNTTRAADDEKEIGVNILRLRRVCPRWQEPAFEIANCWCHAGRNGGVTKACPLKPPDWEPGMNGLPEAL